MFENLSIDQKARIEAEMDNNFIGGLIAIALVAYLAATAAPHAREHGDHKVLYYDKRIKALGWILFAMIAPMVAFFLYAAAHGSKDAVLLMLGSAVFVSLPLFLILEFHKVIVSFDAHTIHCSSPWRRSRDIPWADLLSIKYSESLRWYVVETRSHGTVRLNSILSGLHEFLSEAKRRGIAG